MENNSDELTFKTALGIAIMLILIPMFLSVYIAFEYNVCSIIWNHLSK
jgi:hypothetical protein